MDRRGHRLVDMVVGALAVGLVLAAAGRASACRMWASISNLPSEQIWSHLVAATCSLEQLSHYNDDGWAVGYCQQAGQSPMVVRSELPAWQDVAYRPMVAQMGSPYLAVAHVRRASSGSSQIPDPHPFCREKLGRNWMFAHNGTLDKAVLVGLLGDYLLANPPQIGTDVDTWIDSELYFLLLLKNLQLLGGDVHAAVTATVHQLHRNGQADKGATFILTDGQDLWTYRQHRAMNYLVDAQNGHAALASQVPDGSEPWQALAENALLQLDAQAAATIVEIAAGPGDVDGNGAINGLDVTAVLAHFGSNHPLADLNCDGTVDGLDLSEVISNFQLPSAAPEPPTSTTMLLSVLVGVFRRRLG